MPSLLGTTVAQNYGRMVPQHTYGAQGTNYTNFGTRNLRFIRVTLSGTDSGASATNDLTTNLDSSLSAFSNAVRALQTVAEIWGVFTPSATAFVAVISDDTVNDSDSNSNVAGGWGDAEAVIKANLPSTASTVTVEAATIAGATFTWA